MNEAAKVEVWVLARTRVRIIELNLAILGAPEG